MFYAFDQQVCSSRPDRRVIKTRPLTDGNKINWAESEAMIGSEGITRGQNVKQWGTDAKGMKKIDTGTQWMIDFCHLFYHLPFCMSANLFPNNAFHIQQHLHKHNVSPPRWLFFCKHNKKGTSQSHLDSGQTNKMGWLDSFHLTKATIFSQRCPSVYKSDNM